jgi:hypothetical protein
LLASHSSSLGRYGLRNYTTGAFLLLASHSSSLGRYGLRNYTTGASWLRMPGSSGLHQRFHVPENLDNGWLFNDCHSTNHHLFLLFRCDFSSAGVSS